MENKKDEALNAIVLQAGHYYWMRHKSEQIWRPIYCGLDPDGKMWLHQIDLPPMNTLALDLSYFEFIEILKP